MLNRICIAGLCMCLGLALVGCCGKATRVATVPSEEAADGPTVEHSQIPPGNYSGDTQHVYTSIVGGGMASARQLRDVEIRIYSDGLPRAPEGKQGIPQVGVSHTSLVDGCVYRYTVESIDVEHHFVKIVEALVIEPGTKKAFPIMHGFRRSTYRFQPPDTLHVNMLSEAIGDDASLKTEVTFEGHREQDAAAAVRPKRSAPTRPG